ncbi:MAG: nuclear transport factor 2 family protein [Hyphomonadaceae bacterium]
MNAIQTGALALAALLTAGAAHASPEDDQRIVAALDTEYQAAVESNDAETMGRILHPEMILVVGRGAVFTREGLLRAARERTFEYQHQVEDEGTQTVRLYGPDTAVVTARLWLKGTGPDGAFDRRLWFSDTYVRTPEGWRYAFGQSSISLPDSAAQ